MAPLRVLCIHGYRQNGGSFREKTGALRKLLKKQVELVYMTAPHSVQQPSPEGESTFKPASDQNTMQGTARISLTSMLFTVEMCTQEATLRFCYV